MNRLPGRLLLIGLCWLAVASMAPAQPPFPDRPAGSDERPRLRFPWADGTPRPSHRLIDSGVGDLSEAESLLAQRLHRTHGMDDLHELLKPFQDNPELLRQFKGMRPEDLHKLEDLVRSNPALLDDPKFGDLLNQADKLKRGETLDADKQKELQTLAKELLDKHNTTEEHGVSDSGDPARSDSADPSPPPPPPPIPSGPSLPPAAPPPAWLNHDLVNGMANVLKDIDHSPEGDALRQDFLRELANRDAGHAQPPSGFADMLKELVTSQQAGWLARNLKPPSMPDMGGWSAAPVATAVPGGGEPGGALDALVWVVVLALIGAAVWMGYRSARRQAGARPRDWSPGPWPVPPSQVATREDLIRAFEHLAYLCLGRNARTLNHRDVASQLGRAGPDRAEAAGRLAHLYEQARYAPADQPLPPDELTAARGDLMALAGAAA